MYTNIYTKKEYKILLTFENNSFCYVKQQCSKNHCLIIKTHQQHCNGNYHRVGNYTYSILNRCILYCCTVLFIK